MTTNSPERRSDAAIAAASAAAGLGLVAAGLLLERFCRVPPGADDVDDDEEAL